MAGAGASPLTYPDLLVNDLEPAARAIRPEIGDALDALRGAGAGHAMLTGSGPTAVGLCEDIAAAERVAEALEPPGRRDRLRSWRRAMKLPGGTAKGWRKWAIGGRSAPRSSPRYIAFTQLVDVEKVLEDVSHTLGAWTYLLVGFFAFAETGAFVGLLVPGETVMILGGAVAGQGAINIYIVIGIAWLMAFLGDSTSFFVGRRLGRDFLRRNGPRFGIGLDRLDQIDDYFSRHGGKTIFIGRFVGFVRAFAPFVAGSSGMRYRAFVPYSVLGTGLWVSSAIVLGYFFSRSIDTVLTYAGKGAFVLGAFIVLIVGIVTLRRYLRVEANRRAAVAWMESHAATAWIVALDPPLPAPARVPLESGHAGRHLRARVHLPDLGAGGRQLRPDRLHLDRQRRPGPDARG